MCSQIVFCKFADMSMVLQLTLPRFALGKANLGLPRFKTSDNNDRIMHIMALKDRSSNMKRWKLMFFRKVFQPRPRFNVTGRVIYLS